jgi:uncharacterized RDD family membrane protein YckC
MADGGTVLAHSATGNYAGYLRRLAAWLVDAPLRLGIGLALVYGPMRLVLGDRVKRHVSTDPNYLWGVMSSAGRAIFFAFWLFATVIVPWLYTALQESSMPRATFGKRLLGLQVVDLAGCRISFGRASGRFFGRLIPTFGIGYLMVLFTRRRQTLYDLVGGCVIVRAAAEISALAER